MCFSGAGFFGFHNDCDVFSRQRNDGQLKTKHNFARLTKKLKIFQGEGAGLVAASLISIVPGYISRSVAGSYDNEGIAIFCMLLTYYFWIKGVKTGSILWSSLCALAYFYMVIIHF